MKLLNKQASAALALILIMTFAALAASIPFATAHTPPWSIKTFAILTVAPKTVGISQPVIVYMWLQVVPPTAEGAYGDRWKGYKLTITRPDNTTETKGPYTSDPIGYAWTTYVPTQAGTYKFLFSFPGQVLAGENLRPGSVQGRAYINDTFEASTSDVVELTVQQDSISPYPDTPLPTGYWTRPINGIHREWWSISGNWLATPLNKFAGYTEGPGSAHILWTKEITFGGLVGGAFGDTSYASGNAYEGKWTPPVIINGRLYYNKYPDDTYALQEPTQTYPRTPPKPGFYCVDLRTGEELWYNSEARLSFGQIYRYDSPNQHGAVAYLWAANVTNGAQFRIYDAFTGDYVYTMNNVPFGAFPATRTFSSDGSILQPVINLQRGWLALWNSSAIPELLGGLTGTQNWQWRPYGKTIDGNKGYSWNKTITTGLSGAMNFFWPGDRILGSSGLGRTDAWLNLGTTNFTAWCLNLKPGQEGVLMWNKTYVTEERGVTLNMGTASLEDKVFVLWATETRQWRGYSLDDGEQIWGPTASQDPWDMLVSTAFNIGYGKLFCSGYAGILYCYDVTDGTLLWTYENTDPYYLEAKWGGNYMLTEPIIAGDKIFVWSGEHSPDDPKERGNTLIAVDVNSGELLWQIPFYMSHWARNPAIGDGIIVYLNIYDNRIYAIGKGQTAITVSAPQTVVPKGTGVMITGTVTDQSEDVKGTPAIADANMTEWMKYLYMQFPLSDEVDGVPVKLTAIDPNGEAVDIGTVTSDMSGLFKKMWTPDTEGEYTIIATFEGTESYWSSYAETAIGVGPAPPSPSPPPTSPTMSPTQPPTVSPTATPTSAPPPAEGWETTAYVAVAAVIIIAVVAAAAILLRRRK